MVPFVQGASGANKMGVLKEIPGFSESILYNLTHPSAGVVDAAIELVDSTSYISEMNQMVTRAPANRTGDAPPPLTPPLATGARATTGPSVAHRYNALPILKSPSFKKSSKVPRRPPLATQRPQIAARRLTPVLSRQVLDMIARYEAMIEKSK